MTSKMDKFKTIDKFETDVENLILEYPELSYEEIADSLDWLSLEYRRKAELEE